MICSYIEPTNNVCYLKNVPSSNGTTTNARHLLSGAATLSLLLGSSFAYSSTRKIRQVLGVVLTHIGNKFTYTHRLHFC